MSKKNRREEKGRSTRGSILKNLKQETLQSILAIIFFVLAIFFILAAFDKAGLVGKYSHKILTQLVGLGYFLIPLLLVVLGLSFLRSLQRNFALAQVVGSIVFLLSGLGLIEITSHSAGGVVGSLVASPLIKLFDIPATTILLSSLVLIATLLIFDIALQIDLKNILDKIRKMLGIKKKGNEDILVDKLISAPTPETVEPVEESPNKRKEKETSSKKDEEEFQPQKTRKPIYYKPYNPPPLSLLERDAGKPGVGDIKANANIIKRTLQNFGITVEMDEISIGPSVTRYALKPAEGVKLSRIVALQNDLSLALAAHPIRIEAPIPGKSLVGIEIPNSVKTTVGLGTLLASEKFQSSDKPLLISLGKSVSGISHFGNLGKMPHLLIAGATGSGKSVTIHAIITSLLYRNAPENLKFIMIDPKRVELTMYNKIPHLLTPVITDPKKCILSLKWAAKEMDRRYDILEAESVRDVDSYHKNVLTPELKKREAEKEKKLKNSSENIADEPLEMMPYIVVVIDELADIMQTYPRELESAIVRLAQMSRAVGIHLMLSTQRPSVDIITGLIKANIPARIALQVASQVDSRTILDMSGAEKLLGAGDMLYLSGEMSKPERIQSAFIGETEVKKVVKFLSDSYADEIVNEINLTNETVKNSIFDSSFDDTTLEDDDLLYEEARETIVSAGKGSTSYLQRKLKIGYARAARLMDMLEERGIIGPSDGAKPREVIGYGDTSDRDGTTESNVSENTNQTS